MPYVASAQQQAVYDCIEQEKCSIELVARAGCGKTSTLVEAIKLIVAKKMGEIIIMAYNTSIADELKEKIEQLGFDWKQVRAGTCHSFGMSAWRSVHKDVQVDEHKVRNIIKSLVEMEENVELYKNCGEAVEALVSLAKQRAVGHLCMVSKMEEWIYIWDHFSIDEKITETWDQTEVIAAAQRVYNISLKQCKDVVDFDDMILAPLYHRARFWPKDWVMVDEAQDTNLARRALALALLKPRGRMLFVGDDRQAIYGFTGADSDSMNQLRKATKAKTLHLTTTYRCGKSIVREAQALVPDIQFNESNIEGSVIHIPYIELYEEGLNSDDVILCRNTAPLISTAFDLLGRGIPCLVEGREIGKGLIALATRWKVTLLSSLLEKLQEHYETKSAEYMSKDQVDKIQGLEDQVDCLIIIIQWCHNNKKYSVDDLVERIESMFGNSKAGEESKVLKLSTIHKSKGREWKRVFLLGREKYMPSRYARKEWELVQESNLEYVGLTRAKDELYFVEAPIRKER